MCHKPIQQKWIDELWFRKQLSTCLFVWIFDYNPWAPGRRPGWPPSQWAWWFELTTLVVKGTDWIGSCKSNYHTARPRRPRLLKGYDYRLLILCIWSGCEFYELGPSLDYMYQVRILLTPGFPLPPNKKPYIPKFFKWNKGWRNNMQINGSLK